jgi:hypothetical protein
LIKLEYYESEYQRLKEATSLLELKLWKIKLADSSLVPDKMMTGGNKKFKIDQSHFRLHCRVSCGAYHVVENVWPYLLPADFVRCNFDNNNGNSGGNNEDEDANVEDADDEVDDNGEDVIN